MDRADPENDLCEKKLVEFMHDLQRALQQGKIRDEANKNQGFLSQTNIDSLSNQTFMYIVNWLKNDQSKKEQKNLIEQENDEDTAQMFDYIDEVNFLRNKVRQHELEHESLIKKINELEEENASLKTRLAEGETNDEVERLRKMVNELSRLNEDKDRKVDDLTKQVIRFKRIQEIVLSAQSASSTSNLLSYNKNQKNYDEIDFEAINDTNVTNNQTYGEKDECKERRTESAEKCKNEQITSSGSLSSSISSTSSSNNSITTQNSAQAQAPLATISELTNYSASSTSTLTKADQHKAEQKNQQDQKILASPKNKSEKQKCTKYSSASTLCQTKSSPKSTSSTNNNKSLRQFFGKLMRTSLVNINDSTNTLNGNSFKRGGFRSTANARLQSSSQELDTLTFSKWSTSQVCEFLHKNGFETYFDSQFTHKWIKNGLHLLQASQYDYEKELGMKNALHRKKLSLLLQSIINSSHLGPESKNLAQLDQYWVLKWLDDIGLPQYKDVFALNLFDGRMLMHINNDDFHHLNINSELHFLSIKRAIHVLRLNSFEAECLRRRPSGDELADKSEVMLWTNHRVMEWLRTIDLSEYAPNLRGSGVHGGLMLFEARFNATLLADILAIPASKTLLRRHLTTLFNDLIGEQMLELKKKAEAQAVTHQLTAFSKVKHVKKGTMAMAGLFSAAHKRTKSQDSRDFLSIAPLVHLDSEIGFVAQSATLPANPSNYSDDVASFKSKLSLMTQENLPTSIV